MSYFLKKYFSTNGRMGRGEFFLSISILNICTAVLIMIATIISLGIHPSSQLNLLNISYIVLFSLPAIFILIGLYIKRLHDLNKNGYYAFIILIPLINIFFHLFLQFSKGIAGENKYGKEPGIPNCLESYPENFRKISQNIVLLYKNFFHWNISKICIFLYANIVGFIVSIPFLGVIVYQYFTSYSKLGLSVSAEEFLLNNIGTIAITALLTLSIAAIFISTYTYGNFLLQNVYKSYLAGEKLPYTANLYFSGKHFRAYMGILGWISLYLMAPVGVFLALIIPFGFLAKMSLGISTLVIGGVTIIIAAALFAWFVYLMIRMIFSYYVLLYSEEINKAKTCVDESFRLTKKKVWRIIFLLLPFLLAIGIIAGGIQTGEDMISENRIYTKLVEIQKQSGQDDHKVIEEFFNGNDDDRETFGKIEKAFTPLKEGINRGFLSNSIQYIDVKSINSDWWILTSVFVMLSFFLFEGVASMLYLSIYSIIKAKDQESNWTGEVK